jgi:hypothetical protein
MLRTIAARRCALGTLILIAYALVSIGPMPNLLLHALRPRALGAAYPCDGHACGCQSLDDCQDHCCCFAPAEILAWARTHDREVTLPERQTSHDCPLCHDESAPQHPVLPTLSALECRGVSSWFLIAVPVPSMLDVLGGLFASERPSGVAIPEGTVAASRTLTPDPPPPRIG